MSLLKRYLDKFAANDKLHLVGPLTSELPEVTEPIIYIDGGSTWRQPTEAMLGDHGISVGDGDSAGFAQDVALDAAKDVSDLGFALGEIEQHKNLHLTGFSGGRFDHYLCVLGELHAHLQRLAASQLVLDKTIYGYAKGRWQHQHHGGFSLLSLAPCEVTLRGDIHYPIDEPTQIQPLSSFGLSNLSQGEFTLQCDSPVFVIHYEADH